MKRFFSYLLGMFFSFTLSMFIFFFVTTSTIGSGKTVNSWLESANTVDLFLENALYFVDDIELSDKLIAKTTQKLEEPLGEDLLKPQLTKVINQFYGWLNADKYSPLKLTFDLSNTDRVISAMTSLIKTSYKELPKCTNSKGAFLCYDPSVSSTEVANELKKELTGKDSPLKKYSHQTKDQETLKNIYTGRQVIGNLQIWMPFMAIIFGVGIVYVAKDRLAGLKRLSKFAIGALAPLVIISLLVISFLPTEFTIETSLDNAAAEAAMSRVVTPLMHTMITAISWAYIKIALPLLLIAVGGWVVLKKKYKA